MRFYIFIAQLILAVILAKYVADITLARNYFIIIFLAAGFVYSFVLSLNKQFIIWSLFVFFSLSFPGNFPLPMNKFLELVSPILCFLLIVNLMSNKKPLFSRNASIYFIAIGVLALWSLIHYTIHPVLGKETFGVKTESTGLRTYFFVFVNITVFLCCYWFFRYKELNIEKWLFILMICAVIVGNLQLIAFFKNINIPLINVSQEIWAKQYSNLTLRSTAGTIIPIVLSLSYRNGWKFSYILFFLNGIVFVLFGGGRSNVAALSFVIIVYYSLINRKNIAFIMLAFLMLAGTYVLIESEISSVFLSKTESDPSKYKFRIFQWEGGLEKQGGGRYETFQLMWSVFLDNPLLGKGVGYQEIEADKDFFKEHPELLILRKTMGVDLLQGGHGAYMSILLIYGIGGFFWLLVMLFGSIINSYKIFKMKSRYQNYEILSIFAFLFLVKNSFVYIIGGLGYDDYKLWFLSGTIAGILSRDMTKEKIDFEAKVH